MRKIVLNFIFDCSFFSFTWCCCWGWCCVRAFRVPFTALGVWAIENWNEHYVKNICVFVCDIDTMFNTIALHKSSSSMYDFQRTWNGGEREDTSFQSEHLTYSHPLMYRKKRRETNIQTKMKKCAATNLNFPFDEKKILSCCKRLRINYIV